MNKYKFAIELFLVFCFWSLEMTLITIAFVYFNWIIGLIVFFILAVISMLIAKYFGIPLDSYMPE
jgi:hypothetical protein